MVSPALLRFESTSAIRRVPGSAPPARLPKQALEAVCAQEEVFCGSPTHSDSVRIPQAFVECLTEAVAGMRPVKCVNRLVRFRSSLLYLACYQLRLLLHLFLAWQFRQRARSEVTLRDLPLVVLL